MTLLEMVQDILSAMDSDEVNSISDTTESLQVATAVKHAYFDIVSRANLPEHFELFELNASNDPLKPTLMYVPDGALNVLWVKYNKIMDGETEDSFQRVNYLSPEDFFDRFFTYRDQGQNDVVKFTISGPNSSSIDVTALNNKAPDFYTSFNDKEILFDSYDSEVDTTLMKNKTICYGEFAPVFLMEDSFVPDLDSRQFSLLYNESKASCFADLKQTSNVRAEDKVRKGWVTLQHQKSAVPARPSFFDTTPNYGRSGRYGRTRKRGYHCDSN
jgi:hypothetical protein